MATRSIEELEAAVQQAESTYSQHTDKLVGHTPWTPQMVQDLTLYILGFTCVVLVLSTFLLRNSNAEGGQVLRVFGVVMIVSLSSVLLVVGYSNEQLTPIVGLFGAIAGYLLGKDSRVQDSAASTTKE